MGLGAPVKRLLGRFLPSAVLVAGGRAAGNRVALTFDDGPHPENTPRILDCLHANGVSATFFLQGSEVQKYPHLVSEMIERGHQIANHGFGHLNARLVDATSYIAEVERTQSLLQELTKGAASMDFRPPHGATTARTFLELASRGYRFVYWSLDSRDSFVRTAGQLVDHVRLSPMAPGDILLFHEDYAHTTQALPDIVKWIRSRGVQFARTLEW